MKKAIKNFLRSENGDTNFISIIIILGIVVVLAGVFLAFKDKIIDAVSGTINKFNTGAFNNGKEAGKFG